MLSNSYSHSQIQEQEEVAPLLTEHFALDLTHLAQSVDEKLPAIIITPCMPSSPLDYEVAFLASKKDKYDTDSSPWILFRHPASSLFRLSRSSSRRARTAFCLALPTVVVGVHLLINHLTKARDASDGSEAWPSPFWG